MAGAKPARSSIEPRVLEQAEATEFGDGDFA